MIVPLVIRCQDHPTYRGLTTPKRTCHACWVVHRLRGSTTSLDGGLNVVQKRILHTVRVGSA